VNAPIGYDKAYCEPSDWVKMNQWVCCPSLFYFYTKSHSEVDNEGVTERSAHNPAIEELSFKANDGSDVMSKIIEIWKKI